MGACAFYTNSCIFRAELAFQFLLGCLIYRAMVAVNSISKESVFLVCMHPVSIPFDNILRILSKI